MKAKNPEVILDMYEIMPSYGENSISCVYTNLDLLVDVLYDSSTDKSESRISLSFNKTCSFLLSSFPGVDLMQIEYEKYEDLGSLIEYKKSEAADEWLKQMPFMGKIRHFMILFLSANKRLEVFATDVVVSK